MVVNILLVGVLVRGFTFLIGPVHGDTFLGVVLIHGDTFLGVVLIHGDTFLVGVIYGYTFLVGVL